MIGHNLFYYQNNLHERAASAVEGGEVALRQDVHP
jgi:hypothetical protein